jgi:DNA topoisomerase-1
MVAKQGRYGRFLACSGYPGCKYTESANGNGKDTGVKCPEKNCDGQLMERTSRRGKVFYGCSRYPDCKYAIWDKPVAKACPQCGAPILVEKNTKKFGPQYVCLNRECGYKKDLDG